MQGEVLIDVKNIKKHYGPIKAVDDISFQVRRGDILGFMGPNGAGKSTAMKIITCFLRADDGSVAVAGHDTKTESLAVRQKIGYLPESAPSYGEMTVVGFLRFVAEARELSDTTSAIRRVVEMTGLEGVLGQTIETLSKGFKRRVGLAQALIHDPEVLILDEPTDGLDPNQKKMVQDLINHIAHNKAIILSTHILDEVEKVCNRAVVISKGKLLVDSTPEELVAKAPGHNSIRVELDTPDQDLIEAVKGQAWCARVVRETDHRFVAIPKAGGNHLTELTEMLGDRKVKTLTVVEGRLDDIFRELTQEVAV